MFELFLTLCECKYPNDVKKRYSVVREIKNKMKMGGFPARLSMKNEKAWHSVI